MTRNTLIRKICSSENKKVSVSVGNVREILRIVSTMIAEEILEESDLNDGPMEVILADAVRIAAKLRKKRK